MSLSAVSSHETLSERVSHRRTIVMGIAAFMIYFAHAYSYIELGFLGGIFSLGNWGVDIFLILSGFGLSYSMHQNPSMGSFYMRRFIKVGIPYLILAIPFYFVSDIVLVGSGARMGLFLLDVSTLSYWLLHRGAWYVAMLVPLYCAVPYIEKTCRRFGYDVVLLASSAVCYFAYFISLPYYSSLSLLGNITSVLVRLPSFFVGYWIAASCPSMLHSLSIKKAIIFSVQSFRNRLLIVFFEALGRASLESYLLNIYLLAIMRDAFGCSGTICYVFISMVAIMCALILHRPLSSIQSILLATINNNPMRMDKK